MTITQLTTTDVPSLVQLHQQVLGDTLNARIGRWFLTYLYEQLLAQPDIANVLVAKSDNTVVGFISATINYAQLSKILMAQLSIQQKSKIIIFLFTHPKSLVEFYKQRRFGQYIQHHLPSPLPYVLTLGVDANQQGKGVGRLLMDAIVAQQSILYLDTKSNNAVALRFYERYGFRELDRKFGNVLLKRATGE